MANFAELAAAATKKKEEQGNAQDKVGNDSGQASTTATVPQESASDSERVGSETAPAETKPADPPQQSGAKNPFGAAPSTNPSSPVGRPLNPFGGGLASPSAGQSAASPNRLFAIGSKTHTGAGGTGADARSDDDGTSQAAESIRSLDDLAAVESSSSAPTSSGFADETPADVPTRELPEDLTQQQKQFVDLIDGVYHIIHDHELLGNVIKSIMIELKANPEYIKLICPTDTRTWIRGMRESMGLARIKKTEAKAKRGTGGSRGRSKVVDADMLADLEAMGIDLNA